MTAAMPLLSPSESYKLHAALLEYSDDVGPEWTMYTNAAEELVSPRQGTESLTKATKDLMSLDQSSLRWNESADRAVLHDPIALTTDAGPIPSEPSSSSLTHEPSQQSFQLSSLPFPGYALPPNAFSHHAHGQLPQPPAHHHRPSLTVSPSHTYEPDPAAARTGMSDSSTHSISSVSAETTPPPATPPGPCAKAKTGAVTARGSTSLKRAHGHGASSSDLASLGAGPSTEHRPARPPSKKRRSSSAMRDRDVAASSQAQASPAGSGSGSKAPLLSATQKKKNHIQSEQKRRANIRRGYEALCDTVPALHAAIKAEEEAQAAARHALADAAAQKKPRRRGRKGDDLSTFSDRGDGRAGPRSENVVLQKTIDYITDLLSERGVLLDRLQRARSMLMPGHPALSAPPTAPSLPPLWERTWHGGTGEGVLNDENDREASADADLANDSDDEF